MSCNFLQFEYFISFIHFIAQKTSVELMIYISHRDLSLESPAISWFKSNQIFIGLSETAENSYVSSSAVCD